jgi:uncharacterized phage-associated protein
MLYSYLKRVWKNIVMTRPDPENILQNTITYLCFKVKPLSQTKLMKLVYLANVYHMEQYGSTLAKAPFKHWYYGPFSEEVNNEVEKLCGEGILKYESHKTKSGHYAEIPMPNVSKTTIQMAKEAKAILDAVIEDWGDSSTDDIVDFAKTSLPFIGTPFGKRIDFRRIDLVAEIAKTKNISVEEAATKLVENNKELMSSLDKIKARVKAHSLP